MRYLRGFVIALAALVLVLTPPVLTKPLESLRQADLLVAQKEYSRALKRYGTLFGLIRPSILHSRIGSAYLQKRQLDDARARFQQALELDAKDANALLGLGLIAMQRNEYQEAIATLRQAQAVYPNEPQFSYQLGIAYLQAFEFAQARRAFERAIGASSARHLEAGANYYIGLSYLAEDIDIARSYFVRAQEGAEVSGLAPIYYVPSGVSGLARLMQLAIEELGDAPRETAYVAARLGHALLQVDEKRLARFQLEKAVGLRPNYVEAKVYLGYVYWWEGRQQEALDILREAVQIDPSRPVGHFFLGIALRGPRHIDSKTTIQDEQRQISEAIGEFREAIRLDGQNAEAYVEMARTLALEGRYAEAADAFAAAMRLRPNDVELKLAAIWFHLDHLFRVDRGMEIALEAEQIAPDNVEVKDAIGWALYVNGYTDEAEEAMRQAIEAAPFSAIAHYHLAVLLQQRGDIDGAEAEYRRAIDLDGEGGIARRAEKAINAR